MAQRIVLCLDKVSPITRPSNRLIVPVLELS
jgi:hypothetical protein